MKKIRIVKLLIAIAAMVIAIKIIPIQTGIKEILRWILFFAGFITSIYLTLMPERSKE